MIIRPNSDFRLYEYIVGSTDSSTTVVEQGKNARVEN